LLRLDNSNKNRAKDWKRKRGESAEEGGKNKEKSCVKQENDKRLKEGSGRESDLDRRGRGKRRGCSAVNDDRKAHCAAKKGGG